MNDCGIPWIHAFKTLSDLVYETIHKPASPYFGVYGTAMENGPSSVAQKIGDCTGLQIDLVQSWVAIGWVTPAPVSTNPTGGGIFDQQIGNVLGPSIGSALRATCHIDTVENVLGLRGVETAVEESVVLVLYRRHRTIGCPHSVPVGTVPC